MIFCLYVKQNDYLDSENNKQVILGVHINVQQYPLSSSPAY